MKNSAQIDSPANLQPESLVRPSRRRSRWGRRIFFLILLIVLALLGKFMLHLLLPRHFTGIGEPLPIQLPHGTFEILYFNTSPDPKGLVIVGTGDGGWSYWEERLSKHLTAQGYAVGGWNCRKFADSRSYEQSELVKGFAAAVRTVEDRAGISGRPVWYGGWSTGAEQSVAAASSDQRPENLVGLLLAGPGKRGRFGLTKSDLLGKMPTGPNSFALADMAPGLKGLHVAQFAAQIDIMDDTTWLDALGDTPHELINIPHVLHDMGGAGDAFLAKVDDAISWSLTPTPDIQK